MKVIPSCLFYVSKRFPGFEDEIKRLFREDEGFHTICEDYWLCAVALKRWNESASIEAQARSLEYAELLEDLASEIRKYLDAAEENDPF